MCFPVCIQGERSVNAYTSGSINCLCHPGTRSIGDVFKVIISIIKIADVDFLVSIQGKRGVKAYVTGTINCLCHPNTTFIGGIL